MTFLDLSRIDNAQQRQRLTALLLEQQQISEQKDEATSGAEEAKRQEQQRVWERNRAAEKEALAPFEAAIAAAQAPFDARSEAISDEIEKLCEEIGDEIAYDDDYAPQHCAATGLVILQADAVLRDEDSGEIVLRAAVLSEAA